MPLNAGRAGYYANACVRRKSDSGNFAMQSKGSMDTTHQGSVAAFGNPARVEMSLYKMLGNGLFQDDPFYRELVDRIRKSEQEAARLR